MANYFYKLYDGNSNETTTFSPLGYVCSRLISSCASLQCIYWICIWVLFHLSRHRPFAALSFLDSLEPHRHVHSGFVLTLWVFQLHSNGMACLIQPRSYESIGIGQTGRYQLVKIFSQWRTWMVAPSPYLFQATKSAGLIKWCHSLVSITGHDLVASNHDPFRWVMSRFSNCFQYSQSFFNFSL